MLRSHSALALVVSLALTSCGGSHAPRPAPRVFSPPPPVASAPPPARTPPPPPREDPKLVSRDLLFAPPDRASPVLSPDGKRIAWLALDGGLPNVFVASTDAIDKATAVTHEKHGVVELEWSFTSNELLYAAPGESPEELHVHLLDVAKGEGVDLTPIPGVAAHVHRISSKLPGEALLAINERDKAWHDLVRVDFKTRERKVVLVNDAHLSTMLVADDFQPRVARRDLANGGAELLERTGATWTTFGTVTPDEALTTQPLWLDKTGKTLFLLDDRGRDIAALFSIDLASKKETLLAESDKADLSSPLASPIDHKVQAVAALHQRLDWTILDDSIRGDFAYLRTLADGELHVVSRSQDDKRWLVQLSPSDAPARFYLYDRPQKHGVFLFSQDKAQESLPFARTHAEALVSGDARSLVTYVTLPRGEGRERPGRPSKPLPTVLLVHGGLWARDVGVFDPYVQWLVSRGYAVMQVNFRGSAGFGKSFLHAGDGEWGGKMQSDLIDAVNWAIREKIADPAKVAIFGGSYGGFAALSALSTMPATFACGVDIGGPPNLETYVGSIPPAYLPLLEATARRVGDPRTEDGKKLLAERSPIHHVDAIDRPLLIAQGEHDPRVTRADTDAFVQRLLDRSVPVTYVVYGDEAHGLSRAENAKSFSAVAEIFLAQCLGGSYEPIGDDFAGASLSVLAGAGEIHGLTDALPK